MTEDKETNTDDQQGSALIVKVRSAPIMKKDEDNEPSTANLTTHHEIAVSPVDSGLKAESDKSKAEPIKTDQPATVDYQEGAEKAVDPAPPVDDSPKTEARPEKSVIGQQTTAEAKSDELQTPKIFDTKQYHLPINEGVTSKKGKYLIAVVCFVAVIGILVALDAELVDIGVKLPFDLIK